MVYKWIKIIIILSILLILSVPFNLMAKYRNFRHVNTYLEKANIHIDEKQYIDAFDDIEVSAICSKYTQKFDIMYTYSEIIRMYCNKDYDEASDLIIKIKEMDGFDYEKYKVDSIEEDINLQIEVQE